MKKKILLIPLALLIAVSLVATGCLAPVPEELPTVPEEPVEDWEVTLAYSVWPDWEPFVWVAKPLLEELGYEVTMIDIGGDWPLGLEGILAGDIDLIDQKIFCHEHFWEEYGDRLIRIGTPGHGQFQGLAVPPYVTEVNLIQDLNDYVDLFDGEIIGIEAGAGLMGASADAIEVYGLNYVLVEGSTSAMVADRNAAVAKEEPWLGVWWVPFWADAEYPMKILTGDTELLFGAMDIDVFVTYPEFRQEHPAAAALLSEMEITYEDFMYIAGKYYETEDIEVAVQSWLDTHEYLWELWVKDAKIAIGAWP